jgi:hypothetical protein
MPESPDRIERLLERVGVAVTRDSYISAKWMGEPPAEWSSELEASLPERLQDWDLFQLRGNELVYVGEQP